MTLFPRVSCIMSIVNVLGEVIPKSMLWPSIFQTVIFPISAFSFVNELTYFGLIPVCHFFLHDGEFARNSPAFIIFYNSINDILALLN